MKGIVIISLALLVVLTTAKLKLQVDSQLTLNSDQQIQLSCTGNNGNVKYQAIDLPAGVSLKGGVLSVSDSSRTKGGYYRVNIRASDSSGQSDQRIIVIIIKNNSAQQNTNSQTSSSTSSSTSQTSSQSSTSQTTSSTSNAVTVDAGVNDLLNTLNVPTDYKPTDYTNGYPTVSTPTGVNSNAVNYTPRTIATQNAKPSDANRNTITAEDARTQATFQRQFNAAKALGNLLSIIKQATANKNVALQEVQTRTRIYNQALSKQQDAQLAIEEADRNFQRANAGVATLNQQANGIRDRIAQLQAQLKQKQFQKTSTEGGIQKATSALNNLNKDLDTQRKNLDNTANQLANKELQCNGLQNQLNKATQQLSQRPGQKQVLNNALQTANDKAKADADLVDTLMKRLNDAKQALKDSEANVASLIKKISDFEAITAQIQARVNDLTARFSKCQTELNEIKARLNQLLEKTIPALQEQALDIQNEIDLLKDQLAKINQELINIPKQIADSQTQLSQVQSRLQYLRGQVLILQRLLREAYLKGNAANQAAAVAKENLDAALARVAKEEEIIRSATINLEKARIEKEQADLFVENLLKEGADILPFAAAPDSTGVTEANGIYPISDWNTFVSNAFGFSVKPLFVGDLKTLYPWKFATAASNIRTEPSVCEQTNLSSISGYVIGVDGSMIRVMDSNSGTIYDVTIAPCSLNLANVQDYKPIVGDVVVVKGTMQKNQVKASQTACIRR